MRLTLLAALLFCGLSALAQTPSPSDLNRCGTPPHISPWLRHYAAHPEDFATARSADTLLAGIQIHLVGRNNGTGYFSPEKLLDAMCRLNADYADAGVRFYFKNDWNYIDSTVWYQHSNLLQGIDMMLTNNVPAALNVYFSLTAAGSCAYNLPYAGVSMSHGCSGPDAHVWAHEVGHALSLQHTFLGWEDKVYSFATPTPDTLTYDYTHFHDSLETQIPAPLDTALVEYVDGHNCTIAADRICDTPPDYLSYGWGCDGQGQSLVQQKDPNGATFYSDGTLYMSYSVDDCQNRFTPEQINVLRANLLTEKADWLTTGPPQGDIAETAALLSPVGGQLSPVSGTVLEWSPVPNATRYVLQVSRFSNFAVKEVDVATTETTYTLGSLVANQNYYWRVRPFNDWFACTAMSERENFKTSAMVAASEPDADGWRCYPTLLAPGQPLTLEIPETWAQQSAQCAVYDAAGRSMWQSALEAGNSKTRLWLSSESWPAGAYRLVLVGEKRVKVQSLLLAR